MCGLLLLPLVPLEEDLECHAYVAADQVEIFIEPQTVQRVEVPPDGDPERAQEAVECLPRESRDERVREVAGEGLLCEGTVGVVEAYANGGIVS